MLSAAAMATIVTAAGAQGFGPGPGQMNRPPMERAFGPMGAGGKGWWNSSRIIEQLKLTDEQRKGMDAILLQHREKLIDLRANLERAELAMQPLMAADTPNDGAITAQIDKVVQARADLERANARFLLAIREKLTVDQWKQIQTTHQERRADRWRDRPGMPGPGPRGQSGQGQQGPPSPPSGSGAAPGPGADMEQ
jgi:P pilus assembly/Cpx signaling pathway, periplasmic inhibitor/zinc-resistance associated protein